MYVYLIIEILCVTKLKKYKIYLPSNYPTVCLYIARRAQRSLFTNCSFIERERQRERERDVNIHASMEAVHLINVHQDSSIPAHPLCLDI